MSIAAIYYRHDEHEIQKQNKDQLYLLRVVTKLSDIDGKTRNYGTDQPLFNAEIHMIKSIKENEGIHVTGLADMLGVTKGAVSQIIQKLERKGMIVLPSAFSSSCPRFYV